MRVELQYHSVCVSVCVCLCVYGHLPFELLKSKKHLFSLFATFMASIRG